MRAIERRIEIRDKGGSPTTVARNTEVVLKQEGSTLQFITPRDGWITTTHETVHGMEGYPNVEIRHSADLRRGIHYAGTTVQAENYFKFQVRRLASLCSGKKG